MIIEPEPITSVMEDIKKNIAALSELVDTKQWGPAQSARSKAIELLKHLKKKISKERSTVLLASAPVKAYVASVTGFSDLAVPAKTASKARWMVISSMREAGYTDSAQFRFVRVARYPKFDNWALTAAPRVYSRSDVIIDERVLRCR